MNFKKVLRWGIGILCLAVFARIALWDKITVREYVIYSENVTEEHVFAVAADLHSTMYGEEQGELVRLIQRYSPDAVFMPGDFVRSGRSVEGTRAFVEQISGEYPCYVTTGNHDRWPVASGVSDMREFLQSLGAVVLSGKTEEICFGEDVFLIHGVDDPLFYSSSEAFLSAVSSLEPSDDVVDILLSHRPEFAEYYALCGFDLTVCGHAHGGQVRIPFLLNGLYAPNQGWFPQYAGGDYTFGSSHVIISRGLMLDDIPRVFNPPELVIITVKPVLGT